MSSSIEFSSKSNSGVDRILSIQDLPKDILLHISSKLPLIDVAALHSTCKQFQLNRGDAGYIFAETLLQKQTEGGVITALDLENFQSIIRVNKKHPFFLGFLEKVVSLDCTDPRRAVHLDVIKSCPNLNHLKIDVSKDFSEPFLKVIASTNVHLKSLSLNGPISPRGLELIAQYLPNLTVLNLGSCRFLRNRDIESMSKSLGKIIDLTLVNAPFIHAEGFYSLAVNYPNLKSLKLSGARGLQDHDVRQFVNRCPHLNRLSLEDSPHITASSILPLVSACKKLEHLGLSGCSSIGSDDLGKIIAECPGLRQLELAKCSVTDEVLLEVSKVGKNLTFLSLKGCNLFSDLGISDVANGCRGLRHLILNNSCVTDRGIYDLTTKCVGLRRLSLDYCPALTDISLENIGSSCSDLVEFSARGCFRMTEKGVKKLAFLRELRSLDLPGIKDKNSVLDVIFSGCTYLKHLVFYGKTDGGIGMSVFRRSEWMGQKNRSVLRKIWDKIFS